MDRTLQWLLLKTKIVAHLTVKILKNKNNSSKLHILLTKCYYNSFFVTSMFFNKRWTKKNGSTRTPNSKHPRPSVPPIQKVAEKTMAINRVHWPHRFFTKTRDSYWYTTRSLPFYDMVSVTQEIYRYLPVKALCKASVRESLSPNAAKISSLLGTWTSCRFISLNSHDHIPPNSNLYDWTDPWLLFLGGYLVKAWEEKTNLQRFRKAQDGVQMLGSFLDSAV